MIILEVLRPRFAESVVRPLTMSVRNATDISSGVSTLLVRATVNSGTRTPVQPKLNARLVLGGTVSHRAVA